VGKVLQLAAAAAADNYPPGMDGAAAQETLRVVIDDVGSTAFRAYLFVIATCAAGLPVQQVEVLQQHCLLPLIKLLGSAPRQYAQERSSAAVTIGELMFDDAAAVAGWRLGGLDMLRTLAKALADDGEDVAVGWTYALCKCVSETTSQEVAEALVAEQGAIPRLLQQFGEVVSVCDARGAGMVGRLSSSCRLLSLLLRPPLCHASPFHRLYVPCSRSTFLPPSHRD